MRRALYVGDASPVARLDGRTKLGFMAAFFFSAYLMDSALWIVPLVVALLLLLVFSGALANVRRLAPLFVIAPIASFVIWSFFYGRGDPVAGFENLGVTWQSLAYGAGMGVKLMAFLSVSVLFLSVTRVEEFTDALRSLGLPYRLGFSIALAFRLVPLFLDSALGVVDAQRARGLDFSSGGLVTRLRRYGQVIVPVFMGALRRADLMAMALESRGFGRPGERTRLPRRRTAADHLVVAASLTLVAFYVWAWQSGFGRIE